MARIKNTTKYPIDYELIGNEMLIGSDSDGRTRNYRLFEIKNFIANTANDIAQNNIVREIQTIKATGAGNALAAVAVNSTAGFNVSTGISGSLTVTDTENIIFRVPRNQNVIIGQQLTNQTLYYDYYLLKNKGKGTYGIGGDFTVTANDLFFLRTTEVYNITSSNNLPPVVYEIRTSNIDTPVEDVLNNFANVTGFEVTNDADYFFEVQEVLAGVSTSEDPPVYTGQFKLYRFVGDAGNYGASGSDIAVSSDFALVEINDINTVADDFLSLIDVVDDSYSGKMGYVPMVSYDPNIITQNPPLPNVPQPPLKLKLTRVPTFSDIYRNNAVINGGITHISGLTYNVWATGYVVNNLFYDIPISQNVTLNDGGVDPRIDVFAIQVLDSTEPATVSVVVIEGTPSATPVKPTVDLSTQVEVSFKLLLSGETTDPNVTTEVIYNENVGEPNEWKNTEIPVGATLADPNDPFIGSVSLHVPQSVLEANATNKITWNNSTPITYDGSGTFIFALKTNALWGKTSSVQINLIDSSNPSHNWSISITLLVASTYGFNPELSGWQLLSIPLNKFIASTDGQSEFDTIEIITKSLPEYSLDWINIQTGVPQTVPKDYVLGIEAGDNISVDNTNPQKPKISATALQSIFADYTNTTAMKADQANQADQTVYAVADASDDSNITFDPAETKLQAFYRYNGVATGSIDDYTLISAPYSNSNVGDIEISDVNGLQNSLDEKVNSKTSNEPLGSDKVINMVSLTEAEYNAGTPNSDTFYIITDA